MSGIRQDHAERHRLLGLKISYYRKAVGLTQEQLAEQVDLQLSSLGAVEAPNVERTISLDKLFDIADALNIQPYKLLKFDDD